ncbi:MAG: precorrin-6y C5,15-methyltransferase (decarboxylating) subunit CbiE [Hyphomicrobiales bacterium]|nr:precorrin-6y C5,15-methyltransferase (decarboxylating) subunit CbiE [Hyphomicrobiales bacterium]MBV8439735.1 precorrin-6y C5,15-methyltransferase (decarboxylating) subunit CbiE [Hyphomicrobiales bacterium]
MSGERWLAVVGLGEDGLDGLSPAARRLVAQAAFVVGGRRHLALAQPLEAETLVWPSPIENALDTIEAWRGKPVCVLASGDPFFFGVGTTLTRRFAPAEIICHPAPSAFALAASRLGWSQQDCAMVSLHGRPLEAIIPQLEPGARILALSWDGATPAKLAALIVARGMGRSKLTVCEAMGGPRERIRETQAQSFALESVAALNTIAVEVVADLNARVLPRAAGLADDWFEHDGQITRRDIRAITLSALAPRRGEMLWDVGAGSGSIAIEWMLADPANHAVAIEARHERAARIVRNSLSFGVPHLAVVNGEAPHVLGELPSPDAVFIGGGATAPTMIERATDALPSSGRLVVNAVTLETQAACVGWQTRWGGELVQIAVAHAEPVGRFTGWRPAMPVVQWRLTKS